MKKTCFQPKVVNHTLVVPMFYRKWDDKHSTVPVLVNGEPVVLGKLAAL